MAHLLCVLSHLDNLGLDELGKRVRQRPWFTIPAAALPQKGASDDDLAELSSSLHRFSLETFVAETIPMVSFVCEGDKVFSEHFESSLLPNAHTPTKDVGKDAWNEHLKLLEFLYSSLPTAKSAHLAIKRLCRAHNSGPITDGIIDLAIAFEALINASTEIKFQFALNHSLIFSSTTADRQEQFSLLQSLYDVRSKLVHGGEFGTSEKRKLRVVQDSWSKLIEMCRKNTIYYCNFCTKFTDKQWDEHLRLLAFGLAREEA